MMIGMIPMMLGGGNRKSSCCSETKDENKMQIEMNNSSKQ
jgi:hypothetical protein